MIPVVGNICQVFEISEISVKYFIRIKVLLLLLLVKNIFSLLKKVVFTGKDICFHYWEKLFLQGKLTSGKYVSTNGKNCF